MIRLGAAATNVLASRAAPAAISVLPATAVTALSSAHCIRVQPSSCPSRCCSTCRSAACAVVTTHTCSCSSDGAGATTSSSGSRRLRGVGAGAREPLRRNAALATATPAPESPASGAPAICDPSAYQSLSLLILLHECTRRAYGSLLADVDDLLALPTHMDSLPCCVLLLAGGAPTDSRPPQRHLPAGPSPPGGASPGAATPAAASPSASYESQGARAAGGTEHASAITSASGTGGCGTLRVQHMNRAAAEALQDTSAGAGASGGSLWVEVADTDDGLIRTMLGARGPPQKGTTRPLSLTLRPNRAAGPDDGGDGGRSYTSASGRTIHCPEALLLPLMSPNGTSAGVVVLFERWEVRGASGRVALEGRPLVPELPPGCQPGEEGLLRLQEAVRAQADEVRRLKAQGLTNKDPEVVAAVATLQQLKAEAELQQRLHRAFSGEDSVLRRLLVAPPATE